MGIIIEVRSNKLPVLSVKARARAVLAVQKTVDDIEGYAKAVVPVDTGYLKSSIQEHRRPDSSDLTKYVGPATDYEVYVEYGTSRMRAQPYMRPAAERVRPGFVAAMRQIAEV